MHARPGHARESIGGQHYTLFLSLQPHEGAIVVVREVDVASSAGDDASCAAVGGARRLHCILAIVARRPRRQPALGVAELAAVLGMEEGTAVPDAIEGIVDRLPFLCRERLQ